MAEAVAQWLGCDVFCLASGPSLTDADVEAVREWRAADPERRRVAVANTTFRAAPWADALFAMDGKWWGMHWQEVKHRFRGTAYSTATSLPPAYGVRALNRTYFRDYRNSGAGAVSLAAHAGAARAWLLGYDCSHGPGGLTHWHGSHPKGLGDAVSIARWPAKFAQLAADLRGRMPVVNCSRHTILDCFERRPLEEVLPNMRTCVPSPKNA